MLTTIPFSGFFGTLHDSELDITLEQMFSDPETGCGHNGGLVQHAFSKCDWGLVHTKYAKKYAKALASRFGIDMTFESLQSPREYNFSTDRIFCEISLEEVKRLREATSERLFREEARARFTSGDGFISYYSPDVDDWGDIETWDHNQVGTLVSAYVEEVNGEPLDQFAEFGLMEGSRVNGELGKWIEDATPGIDRLFNIHYYLKGRKERAAWTLFSA